MIYLYGASGHAKVIIEILELETRNISGLVDTNLQLDELLGYPVYSPEHVIDLAHAQGIISIGDNAIRKKLAESLSVAFTTAFHPAANISKRAQVGPGTVVMAGVAINSSVIIGKHAIINTNASIDHDCSIGDYVHVSPGAALAGNITVGEGVHIGIGASVIQGVKIGKWATIGAGAVVINDVPDYAVVVGNPGKIIKYKSIK